MRKLEEDSENFKRTWFASILELSTIYLAVYLDAAVDISLSRALQKARAAKGMTQKALATAINEKPQVVGEYESGKAIPNPQIISKLERALGAKLPRGGKKKKAGK